MTRYSSKSTGSGEVFGSRVLYAAMVVVTAALLMGAIWQNAPANTAAPADSAAQHTVVAGQPAGAVGG